MSFPDRLAARVADRSSQLVLGLDPDPQRLWPPSSGRVGGVPVEGAGDPPAMAARSVRGHCARVIEAVGEQCVAVKLQVACFERLGASGWAALADVVTLARDAGLLVIADAKRGDIGVTAVAYAQAFLGETPSPFGPIPGLGVDGLTVNPLLGADSLAPFVAAARSASAGLFVLVRTSNPGAADVQERALQGGGSVSDALARLVHVTGQDALGNCGLSDVGAVVGATAPERIERLREQMPATIFLLPGVGPQGGRIEELGAAWAPGPAAALVAASRGIVSAHEHTGGDPAAAAAREASRLREAAWTAAGTPC